MISNVYLKNIEGITEEKLNFIVKSRTKETLNISITDYGCGIPGNIQKSLFKEMITTKGKNGTGIGLFMSYSNIKAQFNGDIQFKSEVGKGSTFVIILPISN